MSVNDGENAYQNTPTPKSKILACTISWVSVAQNICSIHILFMKCADKEREREREKTVRSLSIVHPAISLHLLSMVTLWSYTIILLFHPVSYCNIGKLDISQTHHTERSRIILHLRFISSLSLSLLITSSRFIQNRERDCKTASVAQEWTEPHSHTRDGDVDFDVANIWEKFH